MFLCITEQSPQSRGLKRKHTDKADEGEEK